MAIVVLFLIPLMAWAEFQDVREHRFRTHIEELQANGVVEGYGPGIFRPDLRINRAEFLKMTMLARFGGGALPSESGRCFADFSGYARWYWTYACVAKKRGLIEGYPDGKFRGESTVNLSEALAIAIRAWNIPLPYYFREPDHWYDPYIDVAASLDLFTLLPQYAAHPLTRG
ncbi:MAG: S-layer homology domain-containing protein [Patescibacteria group bacterium]